MPDEVTIRELRGMDEMRTIFGLVQQSNAELDESTFETRMKAMLHEGGYRCIVAELDGGMVGVAGFWTGTALWCGMYVEPDNVVVDGRLRSRGIGALLMAWIEAEAQRIGADVMKLEAYAARTRTRDFYRRIGFGEPGVVMLKGVSGGAVSLDDVMSKGRRLV